VIEQITYLLFLRAHKELWRILVEEQKLDAVLSLPGGVSTAILLFTKTNSCDLLDVCIS